MTQKLSEKHTYDPTNVTPGNPEIPGAEPPVYASAGKDHAVYELSSAADDKSHGRRIESSRFVRICFAVVLSIIAIGLFSRWGNRQAAGSPYHHHHSHNRPVNHDQGHRAPCHKRAFDFKGPLGMFGFGKDTTPQVPVRPEADRLKSHHKHFPNVDTDARPACNVTRTVFQAVSGNFDLYDCLEIETTAGSVDVTITPHPGPNPAILKITTVAGSVNVRLSSSFLSQAKATILSSSDNEIASTLKRPIDMEIHTVDGAVTVSSLLGSGGRTDISTSAGSLNLDFLAVHMSAADPVTRLSTSTNAGAQTIRLTPLLAYPNHKIANLVAEHTSIASASIDVYYPSVWEGVVDAEVSGAASLAVQGNDLAVDVNEGSHVRAHRGLSDALVKIVSMASGRVGFTC